MFHLIKILPDAFTFVDCRSTRRSKLNLYELEGPRIFAMLSPREFNNSREKSKNLGRLVSFLLPVLMSLIGDYEYMHDN